MTPASVAITVRLHHIWPERLMQVDDLRPAGSLAVFLDWPIMASSVDAGVPEPLASAVAAALVRVGSVGFRWAGDCPWPKTQAALIKAPDRGILRAVIDRMTGYWESDVVVTDHPDVARAMFDHGWELQGQAALVLDGRQGFDSRALADLATRRSWRDYTFAAPVSMLLAPAVDGDGILIAAGTQADLQRMIDILKDVLREANMALDVSGA